MFLLTRVYVANSLSSPGYINTHHVSAILMTDDGKTTVLTVGGHNVAVDEKFVDFSQKFFREVDEEIGEAFPEPEKIPSVDEKPATE